MARTNNKWYEGLGRRYMCHFGGAFLFRYLQQNDTLSTVFGYPNRCVAWRPVAKNLEHEVRYSI